MPFVSRTFSQAAPGNRCVCGHPAFPGRDGQGHYHASGDFIKERRGPCRDCMCDGFVLDRVPALKR